MDEMALYAMAPARQKQTAAALEKVSRRAEGHGLTLTGREAAFLATRREQHLQATGRIEFGEGILPKLAFAFCDSACIEQKDFAATLDALLECFYHFKNESAEVVSDDELLEFMRRHFDGECQGSVEYLAGTLLERFAERARHGGRPTAPPPEERDKPDNATWEEEWDEG